MPFLQTTGTPFTKQNVEALAAGRTGVYGLFNGPKWVYIGQGDIRARLLAHLAGDIPCIQQNNPTHFVSEVANDPVTREKALLLEYGKTACNQKIG